MLTPKSMRHRGHPDKMTVLQCDRKMMWCTSMTASCWDYMAPSTDGSLVWRLKCHISGTFVFGSSLWAQTELELRTLQLKRSAEGSRGKGPILWKSTSLIFCAFEDFWNLFCLILNLRVTGNRREIGERKIYSYKHLLAWVLHCIIVCALFR